jgi:hypothetical protein
MTRARRLRAWRALCALLISICSISLITLLLHDAFYGTALMVLLTTAIGTAVLLSKR